MPIELCDRDVHVWSLFPSEETAARSALLDSSERARAARFRFEKDRRLFVTSHVLLRVMLSRFAAVAPVAWQFTSNAQGKPEIEPGLTDVPLRFNLSHTEGLAVCAITLERDIGVDVEATDRSNCAMDIARSQFAPAEIAYLERLAPAARAEAFFIIWTLKEAYIKAIGQGLSQSLADFAVDMDTLRIAFSLRLDDDPENWQFGHMRPTARHTLALAVRHPAADRLTVAYREVGPPAADPEIWRRSR